MAVVMLKIVPLLLTIVKLPVVPNSMERVLLFVELNVAAVAVLSFKSKVPLAKPNALVAPKVSASIKRTVAPGAAMVIGKSQVKLLVVTVWVPLVAAKVKVVVVTAGVAVNTKLP